MLLPLLRFDASFFAMIIIQVRFYYAAAAAAADRCIMPVFYDTRRCAFSLFFSAFSLLRGAAALFIII